MIRPNNNLRQYAKSKEVYLYQVALDWQISYNALQIQMRKPFDAAKTERFKKSVDKISILNQENEPDADSTEETI